MKAENGSGSGAGATLCSNSFIIAIVAKEGDKEGARELIKQCLLEMNLPVPSIQIMERATAHIPGYDDADCEVFLKRVVNAKQVKAVIRRQLGL